MLKEKIQDYFKRYPALRILFFFDPIQEYLEEVEALELDSICIEYYSNTPFSLKCKLIQELKNEKVVLYLPIAAPRSQDEYHEFPLLGLLLANKELQLDNVGLFLEEFNLPSHYKSLVHKYISELKRDNIKRVCTPILNSTTLNESDIQQALVSAFLKFKDIASWSLICAKLIGLAAKEEDSCTSVINRIHKIGIEESVIKKLQIYSANQLYELNLAVISKISKGVLYNRLTKDIDSAAPNDPYQQLKLNDSRAVIHLNQLLHDVNSSDTIKADFDKAMQLSGTEILGAKLIEIYGEYTDFAEYNADMVWTLLSNLQAQISKEPSLLIKRIEVISLQSNLPTVIINTIAYLFEATKMHNYINANTSYVLDRPEEYIHLYVESTYKLDRSYRKAAVKYKSLELSEIPTILKIEEIHQQLNAAYDKHTDTLNREWLKCLSSFNFDYEKLEVAKQYDFFEKEIANLTQKVVVVISDAMRYEVGTELLSQMHGDSKNIAEIKYMLASIPSKTDVGMAQLLPNGVNYNNGELSINGISTSGIENRAKILQSVNPKARAVQYSDIEGGKLNELRELFKNPIVYVYHDVIDATGDKKSSERRTFEAVKSSIEELKRFVTSLHSSYNVSKVILTADHGFLYQENTIEDRDKETLVADAVTSGNRYYITNDKEEDVMAYSFPLSATTQFDEDLYVNIPLSVNRYKKQGVGHQFVHGGGSLQELIIPVIESSRQREKVVSKVNPLIINTDSLSIVSNILKPNILQENEVSRLVKERTISIALYLGSNRVSNKEIIKLNSTSDQPTERLSRVELNLLSEASNASMLKLKVFDIEDEFNSLIELRVPNNTLISTDF